MRHENRRRDLLFRRDLYAAGADKVLKMAEGLMCRCNGGVNVGQHQPQLLGVVLMRHDPDCHAFYRARPALLRPLLDRGLELIEQLIPRVVRSQESLARNAAKVLELINPFGLWPFAWTYSVRQPFDSIDAVTVRVDVVLARYSLHHFMVFFLSASIVEHHEAM